MALLTCDSAKAANSSCSCWECSPARSAYRVTVSLLSVAEVSALARMRRQIEPIFKL